MTLLTIFAAPIMQVLGFFIVICIVAWALWWIVTRVIPPEPKFLRNTGYIVYVIIIAILFIWWVSMTFGLGLF